MTSIFDLDLDPTDYFPFSDYFDIYCPHLGKCLGPCQECDSPAYTEYTTYLDSIADQHAFTPDHDTRGQEAEAHYYNTTAWIPTA